MICIYKTEKVQVEDERSGILRSSDQAGQNQDRRGEDKKSVGLTDS